MKFYHETLANQIARKKKELADLQKHLQDPEVIQVASIGFELAELTETFFSDSVYTAAGINTFTARLPATTIEKFEEYLDHVDSILRVNGYTLNLDRCRVWFQTEQHYVYEKGNKTYTIGIGSASCKRVETGKMIPETRQECHFYN